MQSLGPKSTEEAMGLLLALDPWSTVMVSGDVHYTRVERGRLDAAMPQIMSGAPQRTTHWMHGWGSKEKGVLTEGASSYMAAATICSGAFEGTRWMDLMVLQSSRNTPSSPRKL